MTPTEQAARWLADVLRQDFGLGVLWLREADALAAIARHLAPGDDLVEWIAEPHDPGDFVGDIYFGHPVKTTMGTHRWTGTEWVALPSEAEALAGLLAEAREELATLRTRLTRMEGAAARDVLAERARQVESEGWSAETDDLYVDGDMAAAAACYTLSGSSWERKIISPLTMLWPWAIKWWKPTGRRRNLVKAGALILAEIERLDRAALTDGGSE